MSRLMPIINGSKTLIEHVISGTWHHIKIIMTIIILIILISVAKSGSSAPNAPVLAKIYSRDKFGKYQVGSAISLIIPKALLLSRLTSDMSDGVRLLAYYPAMTGPDDPANLGFGVSCAGYCNGRVFITIYNRSDVIRRGFDSFSEFIWTNTLDMLKDPVFAAGSEIRTLEPIADFEQVVKVSTKGGSSKPDAVRLPITEYLMMDPAKGQPFQALRSIYGRSTLNVNYPICDIRYSLSCKASVEISVDGIDLNRLAEAKYIALKVNQTISKMIADPGCK